MNKIILLIIVVLNCLAGNSQTAEEFFSSGILKCNYQNFQGAIIDFTKSLSIDPTRAETFYNRGIAKSKLEDYDGAIEDYSKAIELDPKYWQFYNRGFAKIKVNNYNGAIADFTKAIELKPDDDESYMNRGLINIELGQNVSGCNDLKKAKELGNSDAIKAISIFCQ